MLQRRGSQDKGEDSCRARINELEAECKRLEGTEAAATAAQAAAEGEYQRAQGDNERLATAVAKCKRQQEQLALEVQEWQQHHGTTQRQLEVVQAERAEAVSVAAELEQQYHAKQKQLEMAWREVKRAQEEEGKLQRALERKGMDAEDMRSTCVQQQREVAARLEAAEKRQDAAKKMKVARRADQRSREAAREVLASHENMERQELTTGQSAAQNELIDELIGQLGDIRTQELQVRREWEHTPARGWLDRLHEIKVEFQAQTRMKTKLERKANKELRPVRDTIDSLAGELGRLQQALPSIKDRVMQQQVSTGSSGTPDSSKAGGHVSAVDEQDLVALSYW